MISVIIPVYNAKEYITKCITSIINQTYTNLEIVIVDDGSCDGSEKICDEIARNDKRIKIIHKENGGVSSARNAGLDIATGEYIMFVDADDYLKNDLCEQLISKINQADADIVIGGYEQVTKLGNVKYCLDDVFIDLRKNMSIFFDTLYTKNMLNAPFSKLYKRNIIGKQHFNVDVALGEDFLFNLDYLKECNNMVVVNTAGYIYNCMNENSATKKFRENDLMQIILLYKAGKKFQKDFCNNTEQSNVLEERLCLNGINLIQLLCYGNVPNKYKNEQINKLISNETFRTICQKHFNFSIKYKIPQALLTNRCPAGVRIFFSIKKALSEFIK